MGWSSFASSALGVAGSALSSYLNYKTAKQMQQRQIEWERERAQNAHQWEVQDLRNAGLNPVLSAGGSGASTGGISAPSGFFSDFGSTINSAKQAETQEKLMESQVKKNDAEVNNQNRLTDAQIDQIKQQTKNLMVNTARTQNYYNAENTDFFRTTYGAQHAKTVGGAVAGVVNFLSNKKNHQDNSSFSAKALRDKAKNLNNDQYYGY
ncbi:MAG: hypothetical protein IJ022_05825 [Burkholderiaceae bacterium]|nr:hypothetical protein [Burkholderiaceae bacterium]